MHIDGSLSSIRLDRVADRVRELERVGFDGAFSFEDDHEPFSALLIAARESKQLELSTAIADAFSREPRALAVMGRQLHVLAGGRFRLGLGSNDRQRDDRPVQHEDSGVGEFTMGVSAMAPSERMRRLVLDLKSTWSTWGEDAGAARFLSGGPPVLVRSHGPAMAEMAGQIADGIVLSPFHTQRFLTETTLPAVQRGRARLAGAGGAFEIVCQVLLVTGDSEAERAAAAMIARRQIAYEAVYSGHLGVLESEGWGALHTEIAALFHAGRREEMVKCVTDEVLGRFAVHGPPEEIAGQLRERYDGKATRVAIRSPQALSETAVLRMLESFEQEWEVDPLAS